MSFLRAAVYELERERAAPPFGANRGLHAIGPKREQACALDPVPIGKHLELRFFNSTSAMAIEELAGSAAHDELDGATTHVILTPRDRLMPCARWQVLDWGEFNPRKLELFSPVWRTFRLPDDVTRAGNDWLEIVGFAVGSQCAGLATPRQICMGLRRSVAVSKRATELVGVIKPLETSFALAALQFAVLQKARGDAALLSAEAALALIGATEHHEWRPHRVVVDGARAPGHVRMEPRDPLLRILERIGVRFGAAGLSIDRAPRPCILGRLSLAH
jgi:hypothetical protein